MYTCDNLLDIQERETSLKFQYNFTLLGIYYQLMEIHFSLGLNRDIIALRQLPLCSNRCCYIHSFIIAYSY
jgi:hypothetical protein